MIKEVADAYDELVDNEKYKENFKDVQAQIDQINQQRQEYAKGQRQNVLNHTPP